MSQEFQSYSQDLERLHAERASAWLELLPRATTQQRMEFVAWLKESPRNVRDILLMIALDEGLGHIDSHHVHDVKTLIAQVQTQVVAFPARPRSGEDVPRRYLRPRLAVAAAASIVALLIGGWWVYGQSRLGWREFQTATGEQRTFELGDGSVVSLNTRSRILVRLNSSDREVRLVEGEALFRVRHDAARPFRVYAEQAEIEDVGTQFTVRDRPEGTFIAVLEGKVNVTPIAKPATAGKSPARTTTRPMLGLAANQQASISSAGAVSIRPISDVEEALAWRDRRLVFRQDTLGTIAEEFNRYNSRAIVLEGDAVKARVYSGVFDVDDTDSLAQVLAHDPSLSVSESEHSIVIRMR